MAISNSIKDFKPETNWELVKKADLLTPKLIENEVFPTRRVKIISDGNEKIIDILELEKTPLKKSDIIYVDFGEHLVGYFSFLINTADVPADAPAYLRIKFAEQPKEFMENCSEYNGQLSSSWLQEERIHIDEIPSRVDMPRRYAFRYVEIEVLDTSFSYSICIHNMLTKSMTSARMSDVEEYPHTDKELKEIEHFSLITMRECMQEVVEDGPKRDRRLWIGDLRLAAMINNYTFKNNDLIKRCIYLFAGLLVNRGQVGACLYVKPEYKAGDVLLFDYSLFFVSCLYDYYQATKDKKILKELWDIACRQIDLSSERLDENNLVKDSDDWWSFIDWNDDLNKQAGSQAVFIYVVKQAIFIANEIGDNERKNQFNTLLEKLIKASFKYLWDDEKGFFISGEKKQISWTSQVWFVLAEILNEEDAKALMQRLQRERPPIKMVTPYMYHHFVEALFLCGMKDDALECIKKYWGEMVKDGASSFYEIYDPENKEFSPYGSSAINSYCHAWSATPAYLIRKYL